MKRRLESFTPQAGGRLRQLGAGYTWFVRIAKLTLPLAALVIVGIVMTRLSVGNKPLQTDLMPDTDKTTAGKVELAGAKYEGIDSRNGKYTLIADSASRDPARPNLALLVKPKAELEPQDGKWLSISSATGLYDHDAGTASLKDGVDIFQDEGYEMHMAHVDINLKERSAVTDAEVTAQGPLGSLKAKGMTVEAGGDNITFAGPAEIKLYKLGSAP